MEKSNLLEYFKNLTVEGNQKDKDYGIPLLEILNGFAENMGSIKMENEGSDVDSKKDSKDIFSVLKGINELNKNENQSNLDLPYPYFFHVGNNKEVEESKLDTVIDVLIAVGKLKEKPNAVDIETAFDYAYSETKDEGKNYIENFTDVLYEYTVTFKPTEYSLQSFNDFVVEKERDNLLKFGNVEEDTSIIPYNEGFLSINKLISSLNSK